MSALDGLNDENTLLGFADIPDVNIEAMASRVIPRQMQSGVLRGAQVEVDSTGLPRVLMGNQPTFGQGFYVSKAGVDATTNTDPGQWIFNSGQNVFKIVSKISTPFSATSSAGSPSGSTVSVPHGQTYVPLTLSTVTITRNDENGTPGIFTLPFIDFGTGGGTVGVFIVRCYVHQLAIDATNILYDIGIINPSLTIAGTITTYVLQETAS